ncbi:unnamed protein product [Rhizophagus irregularis]|nr:unnamed protein product [Rhizophagus irregularis]
MNTPKLKILSFDTKFIFYKINNKNPCSFLIKESKNLEITQFFANLTELVLTIRERKYEIFSSLSQICYNIQKLIIRINYYPPYTFCGATEVEISCESYYLASLIRSQHNLVHFELFDIPEMGSINEILKSLKESQHNSLKL